MISLSVAALLHLLLWSTEGLLHAVLWRSSSSYLLWIGIPSLVFVGLTMLAWSKTVSKQVLIAFGDPP